MDKGVSKGAFGITPHLPHKWLSSFNQKWETMLSEEGTVQRGNITQQGCRISLFNKSTRPAILKKKKKKRRRTVPLGTTINPWMVQ
jgi:hypothetical protein